MSQLPLFEDATQPHLPARSGSAKTQIICPPQPRSKHPKRPTQQPLLTPFAATAVSIPAPIAPQIDRPLPPAHSPAQELPPGWVDPSDPAFSYLKDCRLCGALIKIGGLDHSLCSAKCDWVADLQWLAWMKAQRHKRKEPEPQAATHTDSGDSAVRDLFSYGFDTSDMNGGAA